MHIEVLSEDKSGGLTLEFLMATILAGLAANHTYVVRPHRGKGTMPHNEWQRPGRLASGLMDLLPAKVRAYAMTYQPQDLLLIVVMDADADDPVEIQDSLERIVHKFGGDLPFVIGVSVEEIEAWLLGDPAAIRQAYPRASLKRLAAYQQDSVCGTWEFLAGVLLGRDAEKAIQIGYPAIGQYKQEWARNIAPHLDPRRNVSPSFQRFYQRLIQQLAQAEPDAAGPPDPAP